MKRRVVVTGMGGLCPIGCEWKSVGASLRAGRSGVAVAPELAEYEGLETRLAAWAARIEEAAG